MANEMNRGIAKSWSLLAFVKEFGQPRYVPDFKGNDGETFAALSFSADRFSADKVRSYVDGQGVEHPSSYVMVSFSSNCPAQSMEDIVAQKNDLQVVELQRDAEHQYASFKLCAKGSYEERGILMSL